MGIDRKRMMAVADAAERVAARVDSVLARKDAERSLFRVTHEPYKEGHRAKIVNQQGKTSYLGGKVHASPQAAHEEAYAHAKQEGYKVASTRLDEDDDVMMDADISGRRVMVQHNPETQRGGMKEFHNATGRVGEKEGRHYRIHLDEPVEIPGIGKVKDNLWERGKFKLLKD